MKYNPIKSTRILKGFPCEDAAFVQQLTLVTFYCSRILANQIPVHNIRIRRRTNKTFTQLLTIKKTFISDFLKNSSFLSKFQITSTSSLEQFLRSVSVCSRSCIWVILSMRFWLRPVVCRPVGGRSRIFTTFKHNQSVSTILHKT